LPLAPRLFFKDRLSILVGPGVSAFRELNAAPEISILAAPASQQLPTGSAAVSLGGHAIIVLEPSLATFVEASAKPINTTTILGTHYTSGAHWAAKTFVGCLRGLAVFIEEGGFTVWEIGAAPEGTFLPNDPAHRLAAFGTRVLPRMRGWL